MKKHHRVSVCLICLVALVFALPTLAVAEVTLTTDIVGDSEYGLIHRFTAKNGQAIYFVAIEPAPHVYYEDVNFDGAEDVVVVTAMGASNMFCEFFVWDGAQYVLAERVGAEHGLCNYTLFPEGGYVLSHTNDGWAGALHETHLYKWEGGALRLLRTAIAVEPTAMTLENGLMTQITDLNAVKFEVRDYVNADPYGEGSVLFAEVVSLDDIDATPYENSVFAREDAALWQGIGKPSVE